MATTAVLVLTSLACAFGSGILGGEASFDYVNKAQGDIHLIPLDGRPVGAFRRCSWFNCLI